MRFDLSRLRNRLRLPFWHRDDIEAEIESHLEDVEADLRGQGQGEAGARQGALERLGDQESLGDSLQAIHHGWKGGATVQHRLVKLVLGLVTACAVSALWLYLYIGATMPQPAPPGFTPEEYERLQDRALDVKSKPAKFQQVLLQSREMNPRVTWLAIIDKSGALVWSRPRLRGLKGLFPDADKIQPTFCPDGTVGLPQGDRVQHFHRLSPTLTSAGVRVEWFQFVALGGESKQRYIGTAIIAFGPPVWREWVGVALSDVWFWYGLVWVASAAAIFLHRRPSDRAGAWMWGGLSLLLGPLIWLGYLLLVILRQSSKAEGGASLAGLTLVPIGGLAFTLLLVGDAAHLDRAIGYECVNDVRIVRPVSHRKDDAAAYRRPGALPPRFRCPQGGQ